MGRSSIKEDKNIYHLTREKLKLSRERASEILGWISSDRIERIDGGEVPRPDEVICMAEKYNEPRLCNYYCTHQCDIGRKYVPEVHYGRALSEIVLEMLASLNAAERKKDRIIELAADGRIEKNEVEEFFRIQKELSHIAQAVNSLQAWSEQMLANGYIDREAYEAYKNANE